MDGTNGRTVKKNNDPADWEETPTMEIKDERNSHILYHVTDVPPIPATIVFALQVISLTHLKYGTLKGTSRFLFIFPKAKRKPQQTHR